MIYTDMIQKLTNATNLTLRTLLSIPGIAKTSVEIYQDGELLCVVLPDPDLKWVKSEAEQAKLNEEQREAYVAEDNAWAATEIELELTEKQRDRIKAVLAKAPTVADLRQSKPLFHTYQAFGVTQ